MVSRAVAKAATGDWKSSCGPCSGGCKAIGGPLGADIRGWGRTLGPLVVRAHMLILLALTGPIRLGQKQDQSCFNCLDCEFSRT